MEMTNTARAIKAELEMHLAKQGSSLENFEKALSQLNTGEGVLKVAEDLSTGFNLSTIPELAIKSSLAGGALAGLTMDEMDQSVGSINSALAREREKINLVRQITKNLKKEHGLL